MNSEAVFENLEQQLSHLSTCEHYPSRERLCGLFYAIALTPFRITAMEILPLLFSADKPDINALQTDHLVIAISEICQAYKQQLLNGNLHFPYDFSQPASLNTLHVYEWSLGFYQGLQLRAAFWRYENDGISENVPVLNSLTIFTDLFADHNAQTATLNQSFLQLPHAIQAIEKFSNQVRLEAAIAQQKLNPPAYQPERTGRNEPCPCGSGKKYKKCCA